MKETIVYLPMPHTVKEGEYPVVLEHEVHAALDAAGVKWVKEEPKDYQIRMMSLQIEELKSVCIKLQGELQEAQTENGSLAGLLADTQKHVDELDDQNEALKRVVADLKDQVEAEQDRNTALEVTATRAQEELRAMKDHNAMLKSALRQYQETQP